MDLVFVVALFVGEHDAQAERDEADDLAGAIRLYKYSITYLSLLFLAVAGLTLVRLV